MKVRLLLLFCWILSSSVIKTTASRPVFGVRVAIGANSTVTSFVCYLDNGYSLSRPKNVDAETFVKIVTGYWPSVYNPKRIDLFKEHNIDCAIYTDSITLKPVLGCLPIDSLWKIHFGTYPFNGISEMGWSNKYHRPSPKQEQFLFNRYGVRQIDSDYFLDSSFWMIMNDVTDKDWIKNYKSLY